jgi:YHS domain-containing protein
MGNEINPDVFIEYKGVKVYFCCWGCDDKFLSDPDTYIPKLPKSIQKRIRAADSQSPKPQASTEEVRQETCPVMGGVIDPDVHTDYRGVRVYFCCAPCIEKFEANPGRYIPALPKAIQEKIAEASAEGGPR